ncbi:type VI secretion protein [Burkholderia sp. Leaf177]|uniref:type VI secretion system baseplate subunit TssG n=1 Tax=Burkholderia sp. Leaf177 TaxID=1736287 RepID=UPI0007011B1B|nr:type VI secretion system baseplate subunit TssG [Burkholderia sp. Leaf177]KQR73831.1 type VI secretion protein [Burkholderia sp. Leaf177]
MNFMRFCELLELAAPEEAPLGTTDSPSNDLVRFRSRRRLGFPGKEIDAVEYDYDDASKPASVRTTFLGLYGVDARMPSYFIDEIAQNRDGAEPLSAFLDMFHHRIATQFYRAWRKYRFPAGFKKGGTDDVSRCLVSLVGLGIGHSEIEQTVGTRKLLSMLGLASQRTRTAEGLAGVLQHAVPDANIAVTEFHPVWIQLNDFEPTALGENCVLGRGFYDRGNCVRVVITPATRESVLGLTPGRQLHSEIMALLRFYLGYEANAQLEMHVLPELMPRADIASAQVRLGYTSQFQQVERPFKTGAITRVQLGTWTGQSNTTERRI